MEILQKYTGESLTIGIAISDGYDLANIESIKLYLAGKIYPHTLEERMIRCEITSDQTALLYGAKSLWLWFDDSIHGVRKYNLGDIVFNQNKAKESNESVNTGFDVVIPLTITESTVTVGSVVYNYFKGTDGHDGKDRYQSYLDTTDDDPVLTEQEWSAKPEIVAQYRLTIQNEDAQYEGIWLKIPHTTTVNNKLIKILSAKCRIGNGIVDMDLIINYPSAPTYTGTGIYSGFYILDRSGLIKPTSEFEYITIEYDIEDDTVTKYNFKRLTLGKNVISSHRKDSTVDKGNEQHAMAMKCAFISAYGTFGYEYVDTYYDAEANYCDLLPAFEPTYYESKDANLLMRPYTGAALGENPNSNPDFLEVGAHGGNIYSRVNLTASADVLLSNAIAVGARPVNDWQTTAGCTTYGYGMEFFEITERTYLLNKYPQRGLSVAPYIALQIWSNADRTQIWTEYAGHLAFMDWYEIGDKVFLNIDIEAPTFGGTHSNVWTFRYNPESVICTITDIIIDGGVKKFVLDQPIWDTQVVGKYMWAFLPMAYVCGTTNGSTQSPAIMIVGAKMRLIKDTTGFSYKQVRMACRETAVLENETTTVSSDLDGYLTTVPVVSTADFPSEGIIKIGDYKFTYTSKTSTSFVGLAQRIVIGNGTEVSLLWDIYRGFGQIDEEAAIEYLQNKYTNDAEFVKQEAAYLDSIHYISPVLTYDDILDNSPVPKRLAGKGEVSRELISTVGLVKTYRITYTDSTTFEYSITDGQNGSDANVTNQNVIAAIGFTPENAENKQNSLTPDGTGTKFPTVDAIRSILNDNVIDMKAGEYLSDIIQSITNASYENQYTINFYNHSKTINWATFTEKIHVPRFININFIGNIDWWSNIYYPQMGFDEGLTDNNPIDKLFLGFSFDRTNNDGITHLSGLPINLWKIFFGGLDSSYNEAGSYQDLIDNPDDWGIGTLGLVRVNGSKDDDIRNDALYKKINGEFIDVTPDFRFCDFSSCNNSLAYFSFANNQGANFYFANNQGAYFESANNQGANFESANNQGAYFNSANNQGANFYSANNQGASFYSANNRGAYFNSANLKNVDWSNVISILNANFKNADLTGGFNLPNRIDTKAKWISECGVGNVNANTIWIDGTSILS